MKSGRRRKDVLEVFGAWFLEAMQRRSAIVLGEAVVLLVLAGQLHRLVLGQRDADGLPVQLLPIQVAHGKLGLIPISHLNQGIIFLIK